MNYLISIHKEVDLIKYKIDEIIEHRLRGLRPVYEEDYGACERVQYSLTHTEREQNIGCYEHYNMNIANLYKRIIGKSWF